jgi:PAS domain S-box-containing protein
MRARVYISAVALAAVAGAAAVEAWAEGFRTAGGVWVLVLAAAALAGQPFVQGSFLRQTQGETVASDEAFVVMLLLVARPIDVIVVMVCGTLAQNLVARRPSLKLAFNVAMFALASCAAVAATSLIRDGRSPGSGIAVAAALAGGFVFLIVNYVTLGGLFSILGVASPRRVIFDNWSATGFSINAINVTAGLGIAIATTDHVWLLPLGVAALLTTQTFFAAHFRRRGEAQRITEIIASVSDAIVAADRMRTVRLWNPAAEQLFGVSEAEAIGSSLPELLHAAGVPDDQVAAALDSHAHTSTSLTMNAGDNLLSVRAAPLEEDGIVLTVRDVTALQRVQNDLALSQERLRLALEETQAAVWEWNLDSRRFTWALNLDAVAGDGDGSMTAERAVTELSHPDDLPLLTDKVRAALGSREPFEIDHRMRVRGEWRWMSSRARVVRHSVEGLGSLVGITQDIEARRAIEEERRLLREQLTHAQRLEAIGVLAGGVAHDFNNIITAISGYSELALGRLEQGAYDRIRGDIEQVSLAAQRAAELTRQLLAFSRKQVLQPQTIDVNHVIDDVTPMISRLIGEHIRIAVVVGDPPLVTADSSQLEQVIVNLAVNARDAMPYGGTLTIETGSEDGSARIVVSDTGEGMDAAVARQVFEPFFTTKEPGKGTGLGLSTVYGIVHQSGGTISLESNPGRGTTFTITLPATAEAPVGPEPARPSIAGGGSERILVVEDESNVRRLTNELLTGLGYDVVVARNADEALALIDESFDLMITDVVMPGGTGYELAHRVSHLLPGTRVLLMSGFTRDAERQTIQVEGAGLLPKPFTIASLAAAVRTQLDRSAVEAA